mmetsp:Transcript_16697/g.26851  ORF Transcript_16697/g.26851 Transcript_16697/m.26851 type:complete len:388 (-) Transcript_16697:467-1630(-)
MYGRQPILPSSSGGTLRLDTGRLCVGDSAEVYLLLFLVLLTQPDVDHLRYHWAPLRHRTNSIGSLPSKICLCWSKELVWKFVVEAVEALADLRMFGKWIKAKGPGRALEVVVALEKSPLSHLRMVFEPLPVIIVHGLDSCAAESHQPVACAPAAVVAAERPVLMFHFQRQVDELGVGHLAGHLCETLADLVLAREGVGAIVVEGGGGASERPRCVAADVPLEHLGMRGEPAVCIQAWVAGVAKSRGRVARALCALVCAPLPRQGLLVRRAHRHHALADLALARKGIDAALKRPGAACRHTHVTHDWLLHPLDHVGVGIEVPAHVHVVGSGCSKAHVGLACAPAALVRAPVPLHLRHGQDAEALTGGARVVAGAGEVALHGLHAVVGA